MNHETIRAILLALAVIGLCVGVIRGTPLIRFTCIIAFIFMLWSGWFHFHSSRTTEHARRCNCMSNLSQIGKAITLYAEEHGKSLPETLQALTNVNNLCNNTKLYICPSSGNKPGSITNISDWTDYVYISKPDTNLVLAYCPPSNHKGVGGNVLLVNGEIMWCYYADFTNYYKNLRLRP